MTTDLLATPTIPSPRSAMPDGASTETQGEGGSGPERILGMRCRNCGRPEALGANYVCAGCFGPLEIAYDLEVAARTLDHAALASRPAGIWRYLELLPVTAPPARGLQVGSTPLVPAERLGEAIGIERLWLKDDTRNPTLSFKDRAVAVAAAQASTFGLEALACASTGNLAGATAAAAAALGLPAYVFIPADLEPAKVAHALAYGATVVPVDGTYDDVNRLCLEVADELGWGFVNVNLRPFYAEGSKTLAFEVAEQLGWRLPDVIVSPIASGALFTKLAKGFDELAAVGLIERTAVRFVGGQAAGCAPVARCVRVRQPRSSSPCGCPTRSSARWPSAARLTDAMRSSWHAASGGSVEAIPDSDDRAGPPSRGRPRRAPPRDRRRRDHRGRRGGPGTRRHPRRRRGRRAAHRQRPQDTGRGDVRHRVATGRARPARPGARSLLRRFSAFEAWYQA